MATPVDIGTALVDARHASGLSQRALADALGISQPQIARWETSGYRSASLANVDAVSRIVGLGVALRLPLAAESSAPYQTTTELGTTALRALARLGVRQETIEAFCRLHGIEELALFGSSVRKDFGPTSDVDVLVSWLEGRRPTFAKRLDLQEELAGLFRRPVDLVDRASVEESENYVRKARILQGARSVYVAR